MDHEHRLLLVVINKAKLVKHRLWNPIEVSHHVWDAYHMLVNPVRSPRGNDLPPLRGSASPFCRLGTEGCWMSVGERTR